VEGGGAPGRVTAPSAPLFFASFRSPGRQAGDSGLHFVKSSPFFGFSSEKILKSATVIGLHVRLTGRARVSSYRSSFGPATSQAAIPCRLKPPPWQGRRTTRILDPRTLPQGLTTPLLSLQPPRPELCLRSTACPGQVRGRMCPHFLIPLASRRCSPPITLTRPPSRPPIRQ
jgi:hypothetical protein